MKLAVTTMSMRLAEPFRRAGDSVSVISELVIELHEDGVSGTGAARLPGTAAGQQLIRQAVEYGIQLNQLNLTGSTLDRWVCRHRLSDLACAAAFDIALADLRARQAGQSISRLWNLPVPAASVSAITLGALTTAELLDRAGQLTNWPILKLKIDPGVNEGLFSKIRSCHPGRLWVDANGSFDATGARAMLSVLADAGVELFEQPLPPQLRSELPALRGSTPVRLVADEDIRSAAVLEALAGAVDVVNVKPVGCGGLSTALQLVRAARSYGLQVMLGTRSSSVVDVAAAAQLRGVADYLDLDGHLDIVDDPFCGVSLTDGCLALASEFGHGASLADPAALTDWVGS